MASRILSTDENGTARSITIDALETELSSGWVWLDFDQADAHEVQAVAGLLGLDPVSVKDLIEHQNYSKHDDFGDHLVVVLHGLAESTRGDITTYELDCLVTQKALVTVHNGMSRSIDGLWAELQRSPELGAGGTDQLLARVSIVMLRRWIAVTESVDLALDSLTEKALEAAPDVLREITLLRALLGSFRRIARPQLQTIGELSRSDSPLITDSGRRRFGDAHDAALRVDQTLESTRGALKDALDAYYGAQARRATDVSRVLTIYAAILLPLSLVVGFYGMNTPDLPGASSDTGWRWITGLLVAITVVSLVVFAIFGWIRLPSPRKAGSVATNAIREALLSPVHIAEALYGVAVPRVRQRARDHEG